MAVEAPAIPERASRTKRETHRGARIRHRDIDILMALVRMCLLSTSQLTRLFFGAKGTCQKRMRRLFDAGFVRPIVIELAAENRYAITRLGYAYLERIWEKGQVPPFRQPPRIDRGGLEHLDMLNEVRIAMALGAPRCGLRLARFVPDRELRASAPESPIVPDAAVVLSSERRNWQLALEVDTGTESAPVFGRKLLRYQGAADHGQSVFGMNDPVVLVVTLTERRARTLTRQAVAVRATNVVFSWKGAVMAD
ncbi:MAG TPA: replication-relaxation family protein [Polyangiaceae bacterium]